MEVYPQRPDSSATDYGMFDIFAGTELLHKLKNPKPHLLSYLANHDMGNFYYLSMGSRAGCLDSRFP